MNHWAKQAAGQLPVPASIPEQSAAVQSSAWAIAAVKKARNAQMRKIARLRMIAASGLRRYQATVRVYENRVQLTVPQPQPPQLQGCKRGLVGSAFDGAQRRRFLNRVHSWRVPVSSKQYFITLTYPGTFSKDWKQWKLDLKAFKRKIQRELPEIEGFWKFELQTRKAPHYHLLVCVPMREITNKRGKRVFRPVITNKRLKSKITRFWAEIAHKDDQYHGEYATRVDVVIGERGVRKYVTKYTTKKNDQVRVTPEGEIVDDTETMGRQWGTVGKPNCEAYSELGTLSWSDVLQIKQEMAAYVRLHAPAFAENILEGGGLVGFNVYIAGLAVLSADTTISRLHHEDEQARVLASLRST